MTAGLSKDVFLLCARCFERLHMWRAALQLPSARQELEEREAGTEEEGSFEKSTVDNKMRELRRALEEARPVLSAEQMDLLSGFLDKGK